MTFSMGHILVSSLALGFAASASAAVIEYDVIGAQSGGGLCERSPDIEVFDNQLSIRFSGARVSLSTGDGRVAREKCAIRIPVVVPRGFYIHRLTARAQSEVAKPRGSRVLVQLDTGLSTFSNLTLSSTLASSPAYFGHLNSYQSFNGHSLLNGEWKRELCRLGRGEETILGLDLGAQLQRTDSSQRVSIDFSGRRSGVDLWTELRPCL